MVQARTVLWHLTFVGFAINYLICINLNIAIVEMVQPLSNTLGNSTSDELSVVNLSVSAVGNAMAPNFIPYNDTDLNHTTKTRQHIRLADEKIHTYKIQDFTWNEQEQAMVLGAFFWTHWITQLPGGILAKKYGAKLIVGLSNVIGCWLCFLIPVSARMNIYALVFLRVLQGLLTGLTWPAMHHMTAEWIPPNERSQFVTAYFGSAIGVAIFYPLYAYIMHISTWQLTFHITGILGTIWWFAWLYLVYDDPTQHPRISSSEWTYIHRQLRSVEQNSNVIKTPWIAILSSRAVWMNVIGQFAGVWGIFTLMTQTPTYFKMMHHWDIRATGIFSGLPHLLRVVFAYAFSLLADYLLRNEKMSRTNVRKLATGICCLLNGIFVLALACFGTNRILAIIFITLATMFQGSGSSGPLSSMIDIAPNYAGIISGICGTIGCIPGFLSAYIVGVFTFNNQTFPAWTNIFEICAAVLIGSGLLYICFADSTLQSWNGHVVEQEKFNKNEFLMKKKIEISKNNNCDL